MSKFLRVDFQKQPWGYARVGGMEMSASLSVHEVGSFGVAIGDVVAVSHVWGDAQCEVENVQGVSHRIKISSPEKMRRLLSIAEMYGWENLWLDNICINQEDDDEKSREVVKMGYVYGETKATVVLLDSTRLELLRETMRTFLQFQALPDELSPDDMLSYVDKEGYIKSYVELGQDEWYERLWTMQESTLASRIYMAPVDQDVVEDVSELKACQICWGFLLYAAYKFNWMTDGHVDPRGRSLWNLASRWSAKAKCTMYDALSVTSHVECSVAKDRVYGILGLIPNVNITPAYDDTSLEEVAVVVMKECVNNLKQMDILHLFGPKLEEMGKRMVPTWNSLTRPVRLIMGVVVHDGRCMYDENVGLMVSSPRVFLAKIVAVIEPDQSSTERDLPIPSLFRALKEKLSDDQMVELIRGMMFAFKYPEYWDEVKAKEYFDILAHVASLHPDTDTYDELEEKYGWGRVQQVHFDTLWNCLRADGADRTYILGITKDNNCPCSLCKRTYISLTRSSALVEDNLLVVDYGGYFMDDEDNDRVPLIVAEQVQEGVKFISTIVLDRGILHESMASMWEAITIV